VGRRHGEVARAMWQGVWPDRPPDKVPIGHVTNGVHLPSWMAPAMRRLLARHLGPDLERLCDEPERWDALSAIPDEEIWAVRNELRAELVAYLRDKSIADRLSRASSDRHYVEAAAQGFDGRLLTVGFARRIAAYKRLHLLSRDPARALALLDGPQPFQIVIAGKAHPMDGEAKSLVQRIFPMRQQERVARRVVFLEDYDLAPTAGRWAAAPGSTPRPRTTATPASCTRCSSRRCFRSSTSVTPPGFPASGCGASAPRCARWHRWSTPGACSASTSPAHTVPHPAEPDVARRDEDLVACRPADWSRPETGPNYRCARRPE
jgi:starch phosphorylase